MLYRQISRLVGFATLSVIAVTGSAYAAVQGQIEYVVDGDTYQIIISAPAHGERVRARHFDTPEKGSLAQCDEERNLAEKATKAAKRLLPRGSTVYLSDFGRDRYGRVLAQITLADGTDLARWFIQAGLAHPYKGGRKQGWCDK